MSNIDLDLDALNPESKKLKLNGKIFDINPPDVFELFGVMGLKKKFDGIKQSDMTPEQAMEVLGDIKEAIGKLVPPIKGEPLNMDQMFGIIDFVVSMAVPKNLEEMQKRGIKLDSDEKKILLTLNEKSQDSSDSTQDTPIEAS